MLSSRNFATMATWRNDFSLLTHVVLPCLGNASFWTLFCLNAVPDPDPEMRGGGHPDPEIKALWASVWSKYRGGGADPPGPSPGSATEMCLKYSTVHCVINCIVLSHFSFMFVLEWWHPSNSFLGFYRQGELYQQTFTPCNKTTMMPLLSLRQVISLRYLINELETNGNRVYPGRLRKVVARGLPVSDHLCTTPKLSQSKPFNENLSLTTTIHKRPWTLFGQTVLLFPFF